MSEVKEGSTISLLRQIRETSLSREEEACRGHWENLKQHPDRCRVCLEWVRDHCYFPSIREEARQLLQGSEEAFLEPESVVAVACCCL